MKTVMERSSELCTELRRLELCRSQEARAKDLEVRRAELEAASIELSRASASARVLLAHERLVTSMLPDCAKALQSCDKVQAILDQDPSAITKGRDYNTLHQRLGKVTECVKVAVEESWRAVVSQHQGVDEAFLRRVELFPGQAPTVASIREIKASYDESTKRVPTNEEEYGRFEACYAALQRELAGLNPEAFPDDVLSFFRAAQMATGAPLSLFTENVRDWLEKNRFLDGVRVRFTGSK